MRIAILNWTRRAAGGAESYLRALIPALRNAGHETLLCHERDEPADREPVDSALGLSLQESDALPQLQAWSADLLYCHGLLNPGLESQLLDVAPAVFFAHNYYGTCISGGKTWKSPIYRPCSRRFGLACLVHFYPHRCGGLNPVTMAQGYRLQARRLRLLQRYQAVLTHSHHLRQEYLRHGLPAERVLPVLFPASGEASDGGTVGRSDGSARLLFMGRMDRLKGGQVLLDAIQHVRKMLDRPVDVTFAGEGPDRGDWERRAASIMAQVPGVSIRFTGWIERNAANRLLDASDLLVLPSVWPEPFGLVGPEAGLRGVPVAAFATGGIPDWLEEGVNGCLAPGDPPRAEQLADAIARCLRDPATHARLRQGALAVARRFSMANHLSDLLPILNRFSSQAGR